MADRCSAKAKGTGEQCKRWAIEGGKTCLVHGSSTAAAKAAAKRRTDRARAEAALVVYGLPIEIDPQTALLEEVHRSAGHVAWLGQVVHSTDAEDLVWGITEQVDKGAGEFTGTDTTYAAKPSVWLDLYQRERKHLADVCKAAIGAGIAERQVRLAESQGSLLAGVIERVLRRLDLSEAQRIIVSVVVPEELRAAQVLEAQQ